MRLEELGKGRLVREIETGDDLLDRHIRVLQEILGFQDDVIVNPFGRTAAAGVLDQFREILRTQAETAGIESDTAFAGMIFRQ